MFTGTLWFRDSLNELSHPYKFCRHPEEKELPTIPDIELPPRFILQGATACTVQGGRAEQGREGTGEHWEGRPWGGGQGPGVSTGEPETLASVALSQGL